MNAPERPRVTWIDDDGNPTDPPDELDPLTAARLAELMRRSWRRAQREAVS